MASMLTDTDIANMALDLLEEAPLVSIDDSTAVARWFKRNFWPTAWALMRRHPWNFAIGRTILPTTAEAPPFGWTFAFQVPEDCLRVLPLTVDGRENSKPAPFKVEGRQILTDAPAPLRIRYLRRVDDPGLFDNAFAAALAAALAAAAAHFITGKASYAAAMKQSYQEAMLDAQMTDSLEGTPDDPIDDDWIAARG